MRGHPGARPGWHAHDGLARRHIANDDCSGAHHSVRTDDYRFLARAIADRAARAEQRAALHVHIATDSHTRPHGYEILQLTIVRDRAANVDLHVAAAHNVRRQDTVGADVRTVAQTARPAHD